jgi:SAM-dependent methyltransferase
MTFMNLVAKARPCRHERQRLSTHACAPGWRSGSPSNGSLSRWGERRWRRCGSHPANAFWMSAAGSAAHLPRLREPLDLTAASSPWTCLKTRSMWPAAIRSCPKPEFQCGDAQTFLFEQGVFDAVFSRFGTMFFADPRAAFRNLKTALRADGRLSFVCWRRFEENELDALPLRAAAPHLPAELALASQEGVWFSFSEADAVRAVLWDAGFVDVEIAPHNEMVGSGSLKAMVDVCSRVGALGAVLRDHSYLRSKAMPALERALAERDGPSGPALQAATWIVSARAS